MKVIRWGKDLAVRIPASVAARLDLKVGDEVKVERVSQPTLHLNSTESRREALQRLRKYRGMLPADWNAPRGP
ncbi:MAG: AbrB/MazE/SpoVT family DNA-binding domain-containing protein [Caulobacteraceae bacterium]|nr:AbrB/MazE/SpoVT family DNA-binding domain-containing protein [Caulobacteraceae bacterium]